MNEAVKSDQQVLLIVEEECLPEQIIEATNAGSTIDVVGWKEFNEKAYAHCHAYSTIIMAPYRNIKYKPEGDGIWNTKAINGLAHRLKFENPSVFLFHLGLDQSFMNAEDQLLAGQNFVNAVLDRSVLIEKPPFQKNIVVADTLEAGLQSLLSQYLAANNPQYRLFGSEEFVPFAQLKNWDHAACVIGVPKGRGKAVVLPSTNQSFSFDDLRLLIAIADGVRGMDLRRKGRISSNFSIPAKEGILEQTYVPDRRKVFVVHGRNLAARDALFAFLRALKLDPLEFTEAIRMTGKGSPYVGDVLESAFNHSQAVVVLLTGDDEARLKKIFAEEHEAEEIELRDQARPNVLFEAGMALGKNPDRTILIELGRTRPFSDVGGRHVLRFDGSAEKRHQLAERLRTAGCAVDTGGSDWLKAGDFAHATEPKPEEGTENKAQGEPNQRALTQTDAEFAKLSDEACELVKQAVQDRNGAILLSLTFGGLQIETNGHAMLSDPKNPRAQARWWACIEYLVGIGFLRQTDAKGEVYQVTEAGYRWADQSM